MSRFVFSLCICGMTLAAPFIQASPPIDPENRTLLVGDPVALEVVPTVIRLAEPRASQQVLVTGRYADGSTRDLTHLCEWSTTDAEVVAVSPNGLVTGRGDGNAEVEIRVADLDAHLSTMVSNSTESKPVSFRREVMPVLSSAGCSDIRCHGAPSGKNGFRLSLWGSDPDLDFQQLTRAGFGRRTNPFAPGDSLILQKALTRVSHAGGKRFAYNSISAQVLRDWQAGGLQHDAQISKLVSLEVAPPNRVLHAPARWQQLAVRATFADGTTADVTRRTTFSSTDLAVAHVDRGGFVEFQRQGEVAILCRFLGEMMPVRLMHIATPPSDYRWSDPPMHNEIDNHVFAKLKMLHILPSAQSNDAEFVRRLYLDLCGILPTPAETRTFVNAKEVDKRAKLIDRLLQRPEFSDFWTKKWMDVLRVSRDSIQLAGAQAYQAWLRNQIERDVPFTEIVEALLTSRGESYKDPAVNFYCVAPTPKEVVDPHYLQKDLAEATAQLFMGVRLQCAQCHNHPYERWTQDDYLGLAAHFTQVSRSRLGKAGRAGRPDRRQMAIGLDFKAAEVTRETTGEAIPPALFGVATADLAPEQDRRQILANWLTGPDNPFFAKAIVNRIWFHLHGRGIVEPVDDFRNSNPAANDPLLETLAADFVANGYKLRPLIRSIANSRTYQLSSDSNASNENDERYFSHMMARPLPAEVLLDAICDVTGVAERYEIMQDYIDGIPTESVKLPEGTRAAQLPVNDIATLINSSGKYVRYELHPFLRTFGQPNRTQTCECDRQQKFTRRQALELIVGPMVTDKLAQPKNRLGQLLDAGATDGEILSLLYQHALSREPSQSTSESLLEYVATSDDRRQAWEDVVWTVLNSQEFIYQH